MSEAYGSNIDKLRQIKGKYDPNNLFRLNHNVDVAEGVTLTT
jgi:FAD/FMN-containing dehydrogenase